MRVLIVDDERDTVMTLGILLRSEGYEVQLAQGGTMVPHLVRGFRPHAILLDIGMPDLDGYAVANQLRKEYGSACPVLIAVTARGKEADRQTAMNNGFRYHIPKPYSPDALLSLLGSLKPDDEPPS